MKPLCLLAVSLVACGDPDARSAEREERPAAVTQAEPPQAESEGAEPEPERPSTPEPPAPGAELPIEAPATAFEGGTCRARARAIEVLDFDDWLAMARALSGDEDAQFDAAPTTEAEAEAALCEEGACAGEPPWIVGIGDPTFDLRQLHLVWRDGARLRVVPRIARQEGGRCAGWDHPRVVRREPPFLIRSTIDPTDFPTEDCSDGDCLTGCMDLVLGQREIVVSEDRAYVFETELEDEGVPRFPPLRVTAADGALLVAACGWRRAERLVLPLADAERAAVHAYGVVERLPPCSSYRSVRCVQREAGRASVYEPGGALDPIARRPVGPDDDLIDPTWPRDP